MNFVFISPNFPVTYWNFCDRLKRGGVNVLGIGDASYDSLDGNLKASLTEYYKVNSLESYDEVFRAVAFFSFKYGKIDWLESNNEYWLEQDARLRTDFNITTGVSASEIDSFKSKAAMKKYYALGNIPTARQMLVSDYETAEDFVSLVGYPLIAKPEVGVGAAETFKISDEAQLKDFFEHLPEVQYVMEEFITGDIYSYDAIVDSEGNPLFESSAFFPPSIMDIVNNRLDLCYCVLDKVPDKLARMGRATVKAFGVKSRFVHFEFFRLTKAKKGLGKVGDFVGLEVNMRPAGGYTPDMMNYAHSMDVYQIWADMVTDNRRLQPDLQDDRFCVYAGRRDQFSYVHSPEEISRRYGNDIVMAERMPEMMVPQMGNQCYTVKLRTEQEVHEFIRFVTERR